MQASTRLVGQIKRSCNEQSLQLHSQRKKSLGELVELKNCLYAAVETLDVTRTEKILGSPGLEVTMQTNSREVTRPVPGRDARDSRVLLPVVESALALELWTISFVSSHSLSAYACVILHMYVLYPTCLF